MDTLHEKIGQLSAKADAAHNRLDKVEILVRDDLKEISKELKALSERMQGKFEGISEYINKTKGRDAALIFISSLAGAGLTKLIATVFSK